MKTLLTLVQASYFNPYRQWLMASKAKLRHPKAGLAAALLSGIVLFSAYSWADDPVLATQPLGASGGLVKPNLMFVFDTSASMASHLTNDALKTPQQCKVANRVYGGSVMATVTALKRNGTNLKITAVGLPTSINQTKIYLTVPKNPAFSGKYLVKDNLANCTNKNTSAIVGLVEKYNDIAYVAPANDVGAKGCVITSSIPANTINATAPINYINGQSKGGVAYNGGFKRKPDGTASTTVDQSCYWVDQRDYAVDTFCLDAGSAGNNIITVTVADAGKTEFDSDDLEGAAVMVVGDDSACYVNDPPLAAANIQSLFYDPKVEYIPPPDPDKVGAGMASPANRLPSMNSTNTKTGTENPWSKVRVDGTSLTDTSIIDRRFMYDRVFCDTPIRPTGVGDSDQTEAEKNKAWFKSSSHCKQNTEDANKATDTRESIKTSNKSRYPYQYPATTSGRSQTHSSAVFYSGNELHQNGISKPDNENPVADDYVFAILNNESAPFYYNVRPIEYCKTDKLDDCTYAIAETTDYPVPAYVRYCKDFIGTTSAKNRTALQSATALFVDSPNAEKCQGLYTGVAQPGDATSGFYAPRYGMFDRIDVTEKNKEGEDKTFTRVAAREDCTTVTDRCTYAEEMTNMANWYAYYRTRLQMMKSVAGRTFEKLDDKIRVGMITIDGYDTNTTNYLAIKDFDNAQKKLWLQRVYSRTASGDTPLRQVLSKVGQIYAGKKPITGFNTAVDDPVQFSCQQNFTLLTTDGYWNQGKGKKIDGTTDVGNLDGSGTNHPMRDNGEADSENTLADVAKYYYDTDLRTSALSNCSPSDSANSGVNDVCNNNVKAHGVEDVAAWQHMTTYTLGLGVNGNLNYTTDYKLPKGDYIDLQSGAIDWPTPAVLGDDSLAPLTKGERATVDDLWHAAVNGRGTYYSAKNTGTLVTSISGTLTDLGDGKGTGSTTALSNIKPVDSATATEEVISYAYSARFFTGSWSGNLFKRTINAVGVLGDTAGSCVEDDATVGCLQASGTGLLFKVANDSHVTLGRKIYANVSGTLQKFRYDNLTTTQQSYFNKSHFDGTTAGRKLSQWDALSSGQKDNAEKTNLVNYLRGHSTYDDRASNDADHQIFRERKAVLGDIIDSDPVFVGKPQYDYTDAGYTLFRDNSTRTQMVYVGANDGMLHAFDAGNLEERWAYVPTLVMPNMWKLADKNYRSMHTNFVNAKMTVSDIKTASGWKTILVSGLGQGGRGFFALDITDPTDPKMLWEKSFNVSDGDNAYKNLGYSYGKPVVTKKADGSWVVLLTSGYNNTSSPSDGKGHLYVLDAYTGKFKNDISTSECSESCGLAQISGYARGPNTNNTVQYVYGGDLQGNVWRFDIDDTSSSNTAFKLTNLVNGSGTAQPVTVAPTLGTIQDKRTLFIGTGKYLEIGDTDAANYTTQSIYAFQDDDVSVTITGLRGKMKQQTLATTDATATAVSTRTTTGDNVDWTVDLGWYVDLGTGERQNIKASLISGVLIVPTNIPPAGTCSMGSGWLNVFHYKTGRAVDPSHPVSIAMPSTLAGVYVTLTADNAIYLKVDSTDAKEPPVCVGADCSGKVKLLGETQFAAGRATWRELMPAQ